MELKDLEDQLSCFESIVLWCKVVGGIVTTIVFIVGTYAYYKTKSLSKDIKIEKERIDILEKAEEEEENKRRDEKINNLENEFLKLSSLIKTTKDLNFSKEQEKIVFEKYGYSNDLIDEILNEYKVNIGDKLKKALWNFSNNNLTKSTKLFKELIDESKLLRIQAISNAYLGSIYNYTNQPLLSIASLKEAENIFSKIKVTEDQNLVLIRASNYYQLAYYYKTKTNDWNLAKEYYLKSIDLYEEFNKNGANDIQLGKVYNDLYVMLNESNLNSNTVTFLNKAIDYKQKVLESDYSLENLDLLYNSIKAKGNHLVSSEHFEEAIVVFQNALEDIEKIESSYKDKKFLKAEFLIELANVYLSLYRKNKNGANLKLAGDLLDEVKSIYPQTTQTYNFGQVIGLRSYYSSKGTLQVYEKKYKEGIENLYNSIGINNQILSQNKNDLDIIQYEAHILFQIALAFYENEEIKDCSKVRHHAKKAMEIYEKMTTSRSKSKEFYQKSLLLYENCN